MYHHIILIPIESTTYVLSLLAKFGLSWCLSLMFLVDVVVMLLLLLLLLFMWLNECGGVFLWIGRIKEPRKAKSS